MKNTIKHAFLIFVCFFGVNALSYSENMKKLDDVNVHYIALNSTFLTPKIAKAYQLTRSKINALINISVLDNTQQTTPAKSVKLIGTAKNLLGQTRDLTFVEVKEGDAIYYLAELRFHHQEHFKFTIDIFDAGKKKTLTFEQTFYTE